jgi:hypothetical protein
MGSNLGGLIATSRVVSGVYYALLGPFPYEKDDDLSRQARDKHKKRNVAIKLHL